MNDSINKIIYLINEITKEQKEASNFASWFGQKIHLKNDLVGNPIVANAIAFDYSVGIILAIKEDNISALERYISELELKHLDAIHSKCGIILLAFQLFCSAWKDVKIVSISSDYSETLHFFMETKEFYTDLASAIPSLSPEKTRSTIEELNKKNKRGIELVKKVIALQDELIKERKSNKLTRFGIVGGILATIFVGFTVYWMQKKDNELQQHPTVATVPQHSASSASH